MTMTEILVGMALTAILTSLVVVAVSATHRSFRYTDRDSEALGALRTAIDRVEKELRQASVVYPDSTARRLHVWVDYDGDNQQELSERIIWEVETVSGAGHLTRTTEAAGGDKRTLVRNLVAVDAFNYSDTPVEDSTTVAISLSAKSQAAGDGPSARSVKTEVRLRNVAT